MARRHGVVGLQSDAKKIETEVQEAGRTLLAMFAVARVDGPISLSTLDRGETAVLAAVGCARIETWLDVVRRYDDATYQHCLLVAGLAAAFALRIGLAHRHRHLLVRAALVHDIGKSRIPLSLLSKPGRLTDGEMTVMKTHAALGHHLLARQGGFDPRLLQIVRHHHEVLDGSGYPDGLRGDAIPPFVHMMTICDIYAALIERRPYKAPMPSRQALSILTAMQGKLDASLLVAFEALITEGQGDLP